MTITDPPAPPARPVEVGERLAKLADDITAAVAAGDDETLRRTLLTAAGLPRHLTLNTDQERPRVYLAPFLCPICKGAGYLDGARCDDCLGYGIFDGDGWDPADLELGPLPPALMRQPCVDCAFRPGSPEREDEAASYGEGIGTVGPSPKVPFFCHHGMHRVDAPGGVGYESPAYAGSMPIGAFLCRGWWDTVTGAPPPAKPFRDPGGSSRPEQAPDRRHGRDGGGVSAANRWLVLRPAEGTVLPPPWHETWLTLADLLGGRLIELAMTCPAGTEVATRNTGVKVPCPDGVLPDAEVLEVTIRPPAAP
jgi:hypothetical protein